ncbi:O-antigen ligase family protein [Arenibacter echinorum]|uniref:O-antigen ligase-like membrane protein n=1 Tax=Arenibacter echinorum TaxID=440515 RepID=A0A327RGD0_9FLAO|nr:O-antigen ligase family protein [Arenibacter echinorum]RAJ16056.1 O-antigen ligase-like membrane protein [Arenibacter echinorum]
MPSYLLAYFGSTLGSLSSYASSLMLLAYYFLSREKHELIFPFILLGILYYTLSGLNFSEYEPEWFFKDFIRFMIVVVCAVDLLYKTNNKEIYLILLIGGLSIIINAVVFPLANANFYPTYGRFSGFYLNPNFAGTICLIGFALSYSMSHKWLKLGGQLIFTLAGILTFSRSFIVIWLLINMIAIYHSRKNVIVPAIGALVLILLFAVSSFLTLNTARFSALQSIFSDEQIQSETIQKDSRTGTWALYTDIIFDKPFWGNGYEYMQKKQQGLPGVHNTFLMVLGEAGIIPFFLIVGIYLFLLIKSYSFFRSNPEFFYLSCVLTISLMVGHTYFSNYYNVLVSMYLLIQFKKLSASSPLILK